MPVTLDHCERIAVWTVEAVLLPKLAGVLQYGYFSAGTLFSTRLSIISDGLIIFAGEGGTWPEEAYGSVVQSIWTAGRLPNPAVPGIRPPV